MPGDSERGGGGGGLPDVDDGGGGGGGLLDVDDGGGGGGGLLDVDDGSGGGDGGGLPIACGTAKRWLMAPVALSPCQCAGAKL